MLAPFSFRSSWVAAFWFCGLVPSELYRRCRCSGVDQCQIANSTKGNSSSTIAPAKIVHAGGTSSSEANAANSKATHHHSPRLDFDDIAASSGIRPASVGGSFLSILYASPGQCAHTQAIVRAHRWREMLETGQHGTAAGLAKAEKVNDSYLIPLNGMSKHHRCNRRSCSASQDVQGNLHQLPHNHIDRCKSANGVKSRARQSHDREAPGMGPIRD